jgi:nucleotide-binding universal stress UspA family protein
MSIGPRSRREVIEWCATLEGECHDVESLVLDGSPVDVLLRAATDLDASLIVVGRRGAGGRPELRLGSTAHQVIEHAQCPVLVVPADHVPHSGRVNVAQAVCRSTFPHSLAAWGA